MAAVGFSVYEEEAVCRVWSVRLSAVFSNRINARPRKPEEPIAVYAAAITTLVEEAVPSYGSSAKEGEKFRRFGNTLLPDIVYLPQNVDKIHGNTLLLNIARLPQNVDKIHGNTLLLDIARLPQNVDKIHGNMLLLDIVHLLQNLDEIHGNILLHLAFIHHIILILVRQVQITGMISKRLRREDL